MKKIVTCLTLLTGFLLAARADHITGGEMYYTLQGVSNGTYHYRVTCRLFMDCFSNRRLPDPAIFGVFNKETGQRVQDITVPMAHQDPLELTNPGPCITNPPRVCYQIGYYDFDIAVPASTMGYVVVIQVVYRIQGITNLMPGYNNIGATYSCEIPGTTEAANGPTNNSARFTGTDLVVICANNSFTYNFGAADTDGDILRYSFCEAQIGGSGGGGTNNSPAPPPYASVPYGQGYGSSLPLGSNVRIDPVTGIITGLAPREGIYVVTVCVTEIRGNKVIATQRKDLQIRITACSIAAASMQPEFSICKDSKSIQLTNFSTSPLIKSYNWDVIDSKGATVFSSTNASVNYTFADTGVYQIKLVINRNQQCSDSASSVARVYPGFKPEFTFNGICFSKPTHFLDGTTTVYGAVNSWEWDFGENLAYDDVTDQRNPTYTYPSMGVKPARLIVTNINGCRDTITKNITILDKPPVNLKFKDTLICTPDNLQLVAVGSGIFAWSPAPGMINPNTPTPTVQPSTTTTYYVDLNDNGCLNRDSVKVRVVDHVTLTAMADTIICQGDPIQLRIQSDGLKYVWDPESQVSSALLANPVATTVTTTRYNVTARIGSCTATESILVTAIPYPVANAGPDTLICFGTFAQLKGSTDGSTFAWLASSTLSSTSVLNPVATPPLTASYILSAYDTKGCPKPGYDTTSVIVLPDINAYAGRDTSVIVGQPLQLTATGGIRYKWVPSTGLSNATIANPLATYYEPTSGIPYMLYAYNEAGCVDSASIKVKVYQTMPSVFVPNAFTPNGDRHNPVIRPIAVGIAKIEYFKIFNRWGQQVFSTTVNEHGWDGTVGGKAQSAGAYVWVVKAVDYTGAPYVQKGLVVLIR